MEFVELSLFSKVRDVLLTPEEFRALQNELMQFPEKGDLIQGTGGARKIRVQFGAKGKSGGARSIYYFQVARDRIWFLVLYAKSNKSDLAPAEKSSLKQIIQEIKGL